MSMNVNINLFEALTDIGVKPEKAHAVEKQFEAAIDQSSKQHVEVRLENLATKADLSDLKAELITTMYKSMFAAVGLIGALMTILKFMR
jgi:hypothetical protein